MGFQCVKSVSEVVVLAKDHNRGLGCAVSLAFPSLTHRLSYLGSCLLQGRHQSLISSFLFFPQTRTLSNSGWPKTDGSWIALRNCNRVRVVRWASCLCAELSERKGPTARKAWIGKIPCWSMEPSKKLAQFLTVAMNAYHSRTEIILNCLIRWLKRLRH